MFSQTYLKIKDFMGGDSTMNKSLGPVISKYFKEKTVVAK